MRFSVLLVLILFFQCQFSYGQIRPIRFATEFNFGVPFALASLPNAISAYTGLGFRYNVTTAFSIQGSLNLGTLSGESKLPNTGFQLPDRVENYSEFKAHFYNYTVRGALNLERVFRLRQIKFFHRMNPYLVGGAGWTKTRGEDIVAVRYDLAPKVYNNLQFWTIQGGLVVRYYVTPVIDIQLGSEIHLTQTSYLDGIFADKKFDKYLLNYVGVNVKLGATKKRQHIEWNNVILPEKKPRYQKMDRKGEPFSQPIAVADAIPVVSNDSAQISADSMTIAQTNPVDSALLKQQAIVAAAITRSDSTDKSVTGKLDNMPMKATIAVPVIIAQNQAKAEIKRQPTSTTDKKIGGMSSTPKTSNKINSAITPQVKGKKNDIAAKPNRKNAPLAQNYLAPANEPIRRFNAVEDNDSKTLNLMDAISAKPLTNYTVIVGAFSKSKMKNAIAFRDRLRKLGYQAAFLQSDRNPDIIRIMVYSTESKAVALQQCFKARNEIDQKSWILKSN